MNGLVAADAEPDDVEPIGFVVPLMVMSMKLAWFRLTFALAACQRLLNSSASNGVRQCLLSLDPMWVIKPVPGRCLPRRHLKPFRSPVFEKPPLVPFKGLVIFGSTHSAVASLGREFVARLYLLAYDTLFSTLVGHACPPCRGQVFGPGRPFRPGSPYGMETGG